MAALFPYLGKSNEGGRTIYPAPWLGLEERLDEYSLPWYVRVRPFAARVQIMVLVIMIVSWLFSSDRIFLSLAIGLAFALDFGARRAWRVMSTISVRKVSVLESVRENEDFAVSVRIKNDGKWDATNLILRLKCNADLRRDFFVTIPRLGAGRSYTHNFSLRADGGVGEYPFLQVQWGVSDGCGLFHFCSDDWFPQQLRVYSDTAEIGTVKILRGFDSAGYGSVEVERSGQCSNFLGLRPWRHGDSIRRVDWRKSTRSEEWIVREFEATQNTECNLIIDENLAGHSEFAGVSSIDTLCSGVLAVGTQLLRQQIPIRVIAETGELSMRVGARQADALEQLVQSLRFDSTRSFHQLLIERFPEFAPDSLLVMFVCSASVTPDLMREILITVENRRIDPILFLVDSDKFAEKAHGMAESLDDVYASRRTWFQSMEDRASLLTLGMSERLVERTFILIPEHKLAETFQEHAFATKQA